MDQIQIYLEFIIILEIIKRKFVQSTVCSMLIMHQHHPFRVARCQEKKTRPPLPFFP
ncbi:hypothetical protein POUND7_008971 [Theobroma cacao]